MLSQRVNQQLERTLAHAEAWLKRADECRKHISPWRRRLGLMLALAVGIVVSVTTGHHADSIVSDLLFVALLLAAVETVRWLTTRWQN
jgi:hypothetical protein